MFQRLLFYVSSLPFMSLKTKSRVTTSILGFLFLDSVRAADGLVLPSGLVAPSCLPELRVSGPPDTHTSPRTGDGIGSQLTLSLSLGFTPHSRGAPTYLSPGQRRPHRSPNQHTNEWRVANDQTDRSTLLKPPLRGS